MKVSDGNTILDILGKSDFEGFVGFDKLPSIIEGLRCSEIDKAELALLKGKVVFSKMKKLDSSEAYQKSARGSFFQLNEAMVTSITNALSSLQFNVDGSDINTQSDDFSFPENSFLQLIFTVEAFASQVNNISAYYEDMLEVPLNSQEVQDILTTLSTEIDPEIDHSFKFGMGHRMDLIKKQGESISLGSLIEILGLDERFFDGFCFLKRQASLGEIQGMYNLDDFLDVYSLDKDYLPLDVGSQFHTHFKELLQKSLMTVPVSVLDLEKADSLQGVHGYMRFLNTALKLELFKTLPELQEILDCCEDSSDDSLDIISRLCIFLESSLEIVIKNPELFGLEQSDLNELQGVLGKSEEFLTPDVSDVVSSRDTEVSFTVDELKTTLISLQKLDFRILSQPTVFPAMMQFSQFESMFRSYNSEKLVNYCLQVWSRDLYQRIKRDYDLQLDGLIVEAIRFLNQKELECSNSKYVFPMPGPEEYRDFKQELMHCLDPSRKDHTLSVFSMQAVRQEFVEKFKSFTPEKQLRVVNIFKRNGFESSILETLKLGGLRYDFSSEINTCLCTHLLELERAGKTETDQYKSIEYFLKAFVSFTENLNGNVDEGLFVQLVLAPKAELAYLDDFSEQQEQPVESERELAFELKEESVEAVSELDPKPFKHHQALIEFFKSQAFSRHLNQKWMHLLQFMDMIPIIEAYKDNVHNVQKRIESLFGLDRVLFDGTISDEYTFKKAFQEHFGREGAPSNHLSSLLFESLYSCHLIEFLNFLIGDFPVFYTSENLGAILDEAFPEDFFEKTTLAYEKALPEHFQKLYIELKSDWFSAAFHGKLDEFISGYDKKTGPDVDVLSEPAPEPEHEEHNDFLCLTHALTQSQIEGFDIPFFLKRCEEVCDFSAHLGCFHRDPTPANFTQLFDCIKQFDDDHHFQYALVQDLIKYLDDAKFEFRQEDDILLFLKECDRLAVQGRILCQTSQSELVDDLLEPVQLLEPEPEPEPESEPVPVPLPELESQTDVVKEVLERTIAKVAAIAEVEGEGEPTLVAAPCVEEVDQTQGLTSWIDDCCSHYSKLVLVSRDQSPSLTDASNEQ